MSNIVVVTVTGTVDMCKAPIGEIEYINSEYGPYFYDDLVIPRSGKVNITSEQTSESGVVDIVRDLAKIPFVGTVDVNDIEDNEVYQWSFDETGVYQMRLVWVKSKKLDPGKPLIW